MPWTLQGLERGAEQAVTGISLVLKNPRIRQHRFLRIFLYLSIVSFVLLGIANLVIGLPLHLLRFLVWIVSPTNADGSNGAAADEFLSATNRVLKETVSSLPFLALLFMRYVYPKPLDDMFMESLRFIDSQHPDRTPYAQSLAKRKYRKEYWSNMKDYCRRSWKKLRLGILIYLLSLLPIVGRFVFPAAGNKKK